MTNSSPAISGLSADSNSENARGCGSSAGIYFQDRHTSAGNLCSWSDKWMQACFDTQCSETKLTKTCNEGVLVDNEITSELIHAAINTENIISCRKSRD